MLNSVTEIHNPEAELNAISVAHAVAEFTLDGIVISANDRFLNALGYTMQEIDGRHHSMFVEPKLRNAAEYKNFWAKLRDGRLETGEFKRLGKDGREVWFLSSYTPVVDANGNPYKVVKVATDITEQKRLTEESFGHSEAVNRSHGVIEFTLDGTIISANKKFLEAVGYTLPEVVGRHHNMFVEPGVESSASYQLFWARLRKGQFQSATYKRVGKDGKPVWFQASYNPILDNRGKPIKIVKIATDITERKQAADDHLGTIDALNSVHGIAEFALDGTLLDANDKFLAMLGYSLAELKGKPHGMLVSAEERATPAYRQFWANLNAGKHQTAEYRRIGKDGQDVWLRASYTPVLDNTGKSVKIVKFATDITAQKLQSLDQAQQLSAISKSQSVIELSIDGTILTANEKFLALFGYTLAEIQGRHHRIFVPPEERSGEAYRQFWAKLKTGQYQTTECKRIGKGGREIWLQASYNPIMDISGKPARIVKVATDITAQKRSAAEYLSQIAAIHRTQAVIEFAMDGTILTANQNFLRITGFSLEEIQGKHHGVLLDAAERNSPAFAAFWERLRQGEYISGEYRRVAKDGTELWIHASYNTILDAEGKPTRIVNFATDITAQRAAMTDHLTQIAAIHRTHAVIEFSMDGKILKANEQFLDLSGYSMGEIEGADHSILVPPEEQSSQSYTAFWANLNQGQYEAGEYRRLGKDGREFWVRASFNPILDGLGKPTKVVAFATDMTKEKRSAAAAEQDFLTGLPNRLLMNDRIVQAIQLARRHKTRLAVMFLDLDGFKQINDGLGHLVGDKLLQSVATRLSEGLRRSDTVSRQGGDEFLILLPELRDAEDASIIATNILRDMGKPYIIEGHSLHVTTSIGIAVYPEDAADAESLVKNADIAMYQAKETSRNAYQFFRPSMNTRAQQRRKVENALRFALEREEFSLQYQPRISVETGEIIGAEALLRWTSAELGPVPPAKFIPVAEDCGLILPIGMWALRAACRQAQIWVDAGAPPLRMGVNASPMQFANRGFPELVEAILTETRLAPASLEIELSEKGLMKAPDLAITVVRNLREVGVTITVDDFGAGAASLSYLNQLAIRALKIDESLVRGMNVSDASARTVKSIIAIARAFEWHVIAEGVETQDELDFLRAHDCDEAQGYYLGRPLAAEQFASLRATGIFIGALNISSAGGAAQANEVLRD